MCVMLASAPDAELSTHLLFCYDKGLDNHLRPTAKVLTCQPELVSGAYNACCCWST